jgi:exodeoxyribonuclease-5
MTTTSTGAAIELTAEQRAAVEYLLRFPKAVQTLGGYAGTGKSTCVKVLLERLPGFSTVTPTGKACHVLRRKGVPADTIHSTVYHAREHQVLGDDGRWHVRVTYELKSSRDVPGKGFLVDEASMVRKDMHDDLLSYGRPVIFVGDHGQLEPVGDRDFNVMADPDVTLETVHRHARDIPRFAAWLRQGGEPASWPGFLGGGRSADGTVRLVRSLIALCAAAERDPDVFIAGRNRDRVWLNRQCRDALGFPADRPVTGDRVMVLENRRERGLFNGMVGVVREVLPGDRLSFRDEGGREHHVRYAPEQFNSKTGPEVRDRPGRVPLDYAYCLTAHKAQGSEWGYVVVLETRGGGWDRARWNYTAATRAKDVLTWVAA